MSGARYNSERRLSAWVLLAAVGCYFALAFPFFAGQVYVADDLGEFHLPLRDFYAQQISRGETFDWMPCLYGGFYVAAEGQLGGYHPWHWLLYRTLPLGAAFNIELLSSYPLMFAGSFLFLRRLVERRDAALIGALTFTFGSFSLLHFVHPNAIAVVAHLPWLLWAIDIALTSSSLRARCAAQLVAGLLVASQLLLGYPQYVWLSFLAEGAFVAWRSLKHDTNWREIGWLTIAVVAGILMGGLQWIPTWYLLSESVRQAPSAEFANSGSMHLLNLVQLIGPYLFQTRVVGQNTHELGLYIGAVPLALCVWLLTHHRSWGPYRPAIWALLIATALATLLAAGEFGGLYRLQSFLPLVNRFRFPCRAIVLMQLCLAILAAIGATVLFTTADQTERESRSNRSLLLLTIAATALAFVSPLIWPLYVSRPLLVWLGPALIATAAILVALTERQSRFAPILLVLFMAVDLGAYGLSYSVYGRTTDLHAYVDQVPRPPRTGENRIAATNPGGKLRTGDRMLLAGLQRVDGYAGLEPGKQLDYSRPEVLALAGVAWVMQPDRSNAEVQWLAIPDPAPRARLIPERSETNTVSADLETDADLSVRILEDVAGKIVVECNGTKNRRLVTTESYDSGWTATIDGRDISVVRVDGDFLGCDVPAGQHQVRLEFRPRAKKLGTALASFGLGLLMIATCIRLIGSRSAGAT